MKFKCVNIECSSVNIAKPIVFSEIDLLVIGDNYKCPYCRENKFVILIK